MDILVSPSTEEALSAASSALPSSITDMGAVRVG